MKRKINLKTKRPGKAHRAWEKTGTGTSKSNSVYNSLLCSMENGYVFSTCFFNVSLFALPPPLLFYLFYVRHLFVSDSRGIPRRPIKYALAGRAPPYISGWVIEYQRYFKKSPLRLWQGRDKWGVNPKTLHGVEKKQFCIKCVLLWSNMFISRVTMEAGTNIFCSNQ